MSTPNRPDVLVGHKLPGHSLWEQMQRRAQPLALEFCSSFFNNQMEVPEAQKWLMGYGIKVSKTTLYTFYNSMDMRQRHAALQAAQWAETAKDELPEDIEQATKDRIAQHKFELAFLTLSENHRLQLIQLQQNEDGMKGNFALKKRKLDQDLWKIYQESDEFFASMLKKAEELNSTNLSQTAKIAAMRKAAFADVEELQKSGKLEIPKA